MTRLHAALVEAAAGRWSLAERVELGRRFELDRAEHEALLGLEERELERYAASLVAKRSAEFERVVPLTLKVCPDLGRRYARLLARRPAPPRDDVLAPGEAEALRVLPDLGRELEDDELLAPYTAEVLRFEVLRACSRRDGQERELVTGCALSAVLADLERGLLPTEAPPGRETHRFRFERRVSASFAELPSRERRFVGAGIGYRARYRAELLGPQPGPPVLEIVPDHFFAAPAELDALAERYALVFHDVGLSLGTLDRRDELVRGRLRRLRALIDRAHPLAFSDHLALTRSGRVDLGHLCPLWQTRSVLDELVANVCFVQDELGMALGLENIAAPFRLGGAVLDEPEFLAELADRSGAELMLDVSNLLCNARNFGFDPELMLERYPLERVATVHLAGGQLAAGFAVDSHDAPVSEASFALLARALQRAKPRAIIVERDDCYPALAELVAEARRAGAVT